MIQDCSRMSQDMPKMVRSEFAACQTHDTVWRFLGPSEPQNGHKNRLKYTAPSSKPDPASTSRTRFHHYSLYSFAKLRPMTRNSFRGQGPHKLKCEFTVSTKMAPRLIPNAFPILDMGTLCKSQLQHYSLLLKN